jgi:hypothetical protein
LPIIRGAGFRALACYCNGCIVRNGGDASSSTAKVNEEMLESPETSAATQLQTYYSTNSTNQPTQPIGHLHPIEITDADFGAMPSNFTRHYIRWYTATI